MNHAMIKRVASRYMNAQEKPTKVMFAQAVLDNPLYHQLARPLAFDYPISN